MKLTAEEQKQLDTTTGLDLYEYSLYDTDYVTEGTWDLHGLVHRILADDPKSIVVGLMIRSRSYWNQDAVDRPRNRNIDFYFGRLLSAIGTKDGQLLAEMKKSLPINALWNGSDWESSIYEILLPLLHKDFHLAVEKSDAAQKRLKAFPSWGKPILLALSAVATNQPESLKEAILGAISNVKKIKAIDPAYKVVYPTAHDLWQVGQYCRPGMLEGWAPPPKLPWDQEYHEFLQSIQDAQEVIDGERANEKLRKMLEVKAWK